MDDVPHRHALLRNYACVFALQEIENWKVSEMNVHGFECSGWDAGRTAILCPIQLCQVRRSWESHERCTAVLIGSMMVLSVSMPHGGYDEEEYITELEFVKIIMEEVKRMGVKDFLIGGDLNIELKLEPGEQD